MIRTLPLVCLSLTLAWSGHSVHAGELDPPAGPIGPTMKPLDALEPRIAINATNVPGNADALFRITQPGSYYLTGDVSGAAGKTGIEIAASGVTLDLMGFTLAGVPGSLHGVVVVAGGERHRVTVRNGTVSGWDGSGVDLGGTSGELSLIEGVSVQSNALLGIRCGFRGTVRACRAVNNGFGGISALNGSLVESCVAHGNTGSGIAAGSDSVIRGCTASASTGSGITAGANSHVSACASTGNGSQGVSVGSGSAIVNCAASGNALNGISVNATGCTVTGCASFGNTGNGILAGTGVTITACSVTNNGLNGINAAAAAAVWSCTARGNGFDGIATGDGSTIADCTSAQNAADGVRVTSDSTVRNNNCDGNGAGAGEGAGVHATGSDNRIEGNNCTDNDRGIDVDDAGNFVARNTCSGNTVNWAVATGNVCRAVIATAGGAINGSSGGTAPSSEDSASINFTY